MPYFNTKDGEVVHFESHRDPIEPIASKAGAWLAFKWIPIAIMLANVFLISTSRWGLALTLIATFILVRLGYKAARAAVAEAAEWSVNLSRVDKYRAQSAKYQRPAVYELER